MKKQLIAAAALAVMGASVSAAPLGNSSDTTNYVKVGSATFPSTAAVSAISMKRNDGSWSGYVNIAAAPVTQIRNSATANAAGPFYAKWPTDGNNIAQTWLYTSNGVADILSLRQTRYVDDSGWPHIGGMAFAQLKDSAGNPLGAGQNVFWGEWAAAVATPSTGNSTNLNMADGSRTVWYVGDNPTTSMPTLSNATYNVVGIRQTGEGSNLPYSPNLYSGVLTANYNASSLPIFNTLTGSLSRTGDTSVPINSIISGNGSFSGNGAQGQFYNNANALAGIYTGGGTAASNIAFGGSWNGTGTITPAP